MPRAASAMLVLRTTERYLSRARPRFKGTTRDVIYRGYASGTSMRSFIEASDVAALALPRVRRARLISGQMIAVDGHTENPDPKI